VISGRGPEASSSPQGLRSAGTVGRVTERCDGCGFEWDAIDRAEVAPGVVRCTSAIAQRLRTVGASAAVRTEGLGWSALEYAAHVRDVLLNVRDRIIQTLIEDDPQYAMIWRDERVDRGLYAGDAVDEVADEVAIAGRLFARTFDRIDPDLLTRTGVYAFPEPRPRTVLWIAAQALHECEHHLADIDERIVGPR